MTKRKNKKRRNTPRQPQPQKVLSPVAENLPAADDLLLLTVPQVCKLLNLSRSTLDRMAKEGLVSGRLKIGGQVRYHRPTLETWLLEQLSSS